MLADNTDELIRLASTLVETQTTRPNWKEKIKSRKFWMSAAGCIVGICGMIGCSNNTTAIIVFAILEIASIAIYCISEGVIDANRSKQLAEAASKLFEMIGGAIDAEDYVEGNLGIDIPDPQAEMAVLDYETDESTEINNTEE